MEISHRDYLKNVVKFHEIGKIQNQRIVNLIHVNFRLAYLRDNALGFFLDERSIALISLVFITSF